MALTNATTLADYGAGIGTQGATLKVDATNKRVGVGTDSPAGPEGSLQVGTGITFFGNTGIVSAIGGKFSGDFTVGGALTFEDVTNIDSVGIITAQSHVSIADSILHTGDTDTSIRFPAAGTFTVETNGSEAFRVDSSQRLLVNTTSEMETFGSAALQVATAAGGTLVLGRDDTSVSVDNGIGAIYFDTKAGGSFAESAVIAAEADAAQGSGDYPSRLVFKTTADGSGSVTERVRITGIGSVGIGTDDPKMLLDVSNSSGTGAQMMFHDSSTGYALGNGVRVGYNGSGAQIWNFESTYVRFATSNAERVRITGIGSFGIGTTDPEVDFVLRSSKASAAIAKDGLTVKTSDDLHTTYDTLQIGAGGALASYSTATATADTQLVHNSYRHSGGTQKYRYADTAMRFRMNSPGGTFIFDNAPSGSADADITFTERLRIDVSGNLNAAGIATATQLFEGTTRVATTGKAIAMAMLFG